jgi:predicted dinucleotide-binding enzyme
VVKAFNTLGAEHLANPVIGGVTADLFIAGDEASAKQTATDLGKQLGFNVIDLGPLRNARVLEHIAIAWIHLAMKGGMGRSIAFKVLTE